jgi:muramoyltetrapeptide carboxypeptidase
MKMCDRAIVRCGTRFFMKLRKPRQLNPGDTIGLVAPASAPPDPKAIDRSVAALEALGFKVRLARNTRKRLGFLAGTDRERASDLMRMFQDRSVQGIMCVRGGYGSGRLLGMLDYPLIAKNAKVFMGYSDITSLHCALLVKAGLVSFHGPMTNSELIKDELPSFTIQSLLRTLMRPLPVGSISEGYTGKTVQVLRKGKVSGPLIGGNMTLLCTLPGTPYLPDFKGAILFFEDLDEVPYRFDRLLTHLLNAGVLAQVAGVAIGINKNCEESKAKSKKEYRQTLEDVFKDRLLPLRVPVVSGLPFGHVPHNATLPIGVTATLDANQGDLVITEAAVT